MHSSEARLGTDRMTRTFLHSFDPVSVCPVKTATVNLDATEIEDAGIKQRRETSNMVDM